MAEPIEPQHHKMMNDLAHELDGRFNPPILPGLPRGERKTGFFLAVFDFNTNGEGGRFNYISNADRLDVRVLLREMQARFEGQAQTSGRA
ncbi:hypothetical protein [Brevundimonas subvibrioides]|uniref:Uncharacterized protein n=1 Tax=Brevundimonas subvibrioides (strain ATCC 15264 / DSM 4735 / LMG 14903 / NBRC 16000 / CB 81) TaxID=633149 RepID=D9QFV4_BRESC|nr:hypothetical protein [Brevundimonas subvibrioides]ADL00668.1 hypothetical protein Bresu_1356 [Brevundimonas subvibrioides ATCC 15264]